MSEYYNVVPWFNSNEWLQVYNDIYITDKKADAHNLLLIWKARSPSLPSGIESTLTLLEVLIQDENRTDETNNDQLMRLAYSSAIMRFVNHMLDTETARGTSLYEAAKNLGVPDWIIDLRHDTAHSNNLSSIELLREASSIGLDWLRVNYWEQYKECIEDFKSNPQETGSSEHNKIDVLMHFCLSLSFCAHSRCMIKNFSDIPNTSMRESIVNDARYLFGENSSKLKKTPISSLLNSLNIHAKTFIYNQETTAFAVKSLLGKDSLLLSKDILNFLGSRNFNKKKKINANYVQCFEVLLTFLHTNDILLDFLLELINISKSNCSDEDHKSCLAALWVSEILRALRKCKEFAKKMKRDNLKKTRTRNELKTLYHHWFPGENQNELLLDLQKPVPVQFTQIEYIQPIISSYNPYLRYFIRDLLNLVEPQLPNTITTNICHLAELISSPEKFPIVSTKIYTIDDIELDDPTDKSLTQKENIVEKTALATVMPDNITSQSSSLGIWRISSDHNWASCPIGVLPWQME